MPNRVPWAERTFSFDFPADLHPELIERLRGTPARVEEIVRSVPASMLTRRDGHAWSIQENIAHLGDLEALFTGRLDDYEGGAVSLRPADMTNRLTHEANHNARAIEEVLDSFRIRRAELIARLEDLSPSEFERTAMHPRLERPMRIVDMMLFHAEHDDYHLARIRTLIRLFSTP